MADVSAGPELDALIARCLFNLRVVNDFDGRPKYINRVERTYNITLEPLRTYSTTWEGMRLVVERMRELGWYVGISTWPLEGAGQCRAAFYHAVGEGVGAAEGDALAHAVCLAALKAVRA